MPPIPVLHYRTLFLGLTETFIARQIEGLRAGGAYDPYALTQVRGVLSPLPDDHVFAVRGGSVKVAGSTSKAGAAGPASPSTRWLERALAPAHRLNAVRIRAGLARSAAPVTPEARRWVERVRPALIHAHFGLDAVGIAPLARELGVPLVATFYGFDISAVPKSAIWRARYRGLFAQGAAVVAEGSTMLRRLEELGLPAAKARLIRNPSPVETLEFAPRRRPDAGAPIRMVFVGRFVEKKGLRHALNALAALRPEFPRLRLDIVGGGELEADLRARAERLGLLAGAEPAAVFHGPLSYGDLAEVMRAADFMIAPSVTATDGDNEGGAPNILLDAQAMGLPIVATTHCDIPEFTAPGRSALLAPEGDAAALADRVRELLLAPERADWGAMGRAGRAHVEAHFSTARVIREIESLYAEILAR